MAKKGNNKNVVSFWFWMFALFVIALPCIGVIMIVVCFYMWFFLSKSLLTISHYNF